MFAKLYESKEYGQVLVMLDTGDDGTPCVSFYAEPEGFGVCSISSKFKDTEEGWDKAEAFFEKVDDEIALKAASSICDGLN